MRATPFSVEAVEKLTAGHPGARGVRRLRQVLPLVDGGAASPRETWLRLLLMDAGFPRPTTQIPLMDYAENLAVLDMGWKEFKVAAEYDGDQHRTDRRRYVWDQRRSRMVVRLGWDVARVIKEDHPLDVIARVEEALRARGWRGEIALPQGRTRRLSA
jgi:very-short-patch-repair endonuclease